MALTNIQGAVCRLLAASRTAAGEAYVAGGVALNTILGAPRISRDIDLFHDTEAALQSTWDADRALLEGAGYELEILRERPSFVHAIARKDGEGVALEWARDSAFRFFPLVTHPVLGLTLHPFDLATNKILALVGRVEARDWVDAITCTEKIQPLGYLAWAACGKDPGDNPRSILEAAARSARYRQADLDALAFDGPSPDAGELARRWRESLAEARAVIEQLPLDRVGHAVLGADHELLRLAPQRLGPALAEGGVSFHRGSIRGAFPTLR